MSVKIIKSLVFTYHSLFPSSIATCRYMPTCSQYSIDAVEKHGLIKGSFLTILRILRCHPFSSHPQVDPA